MIMYSETVSSTCTHDVVVKLSHLMQNAKSRVSEGALSLETSEEPHRRHPNQTPEDTRGSCPPVRQTLELAEGDGDLQTTPPTTTTPGALCSPERVSVL